MSSLRLVSLARPLRPLVVRSYHATRVASASSGQPQPPKNSKYASPYDVPLTEQAKEVAGDVSKKLAEVAGKTVGLGKKALEKVKDVTGSMTHPGPGTRSFHSQPALAAGSLKDAASDAMGKIKQAARDVNNATMAGSDGAPAGSATRNSTRREGYSQGRGNEVASSAFQPADRSSASEPVRQAARSEQLSTSTGRSQSFTVGGGAANEQHAQNSTHSMGQNMNSVKKSLFDGPQEMPQGVGQRAHDAKGRPMETGTPGS